MVTLNGDGNKTEELYLNANLTPTNNSEGIGKINYQYNKACLAKAKKEEEHGFAQKPDKLRKPGLKSTEPCQKLRFPK